MIKTIERVAIFGSMDEARAVMLQYQLPVTKVLLIWNELVKIEEEAPVKQDLPKFSDVKSEGLDANIPTPTKSKKPVMVEL